MHTWALFSCSSLITLTAYNLNQLPKTDKPGPEPEPDASSKFVDDAKFSLDVMSGMFPEFEAQIAQPALPDQPQLTKVDELPGYNPALYDPAQYPVQEIDLVGALPQTDLELSGGDRPVTYRSDAVKPLPSLGAPLPLPTPLASPLPAAIAATPPTVTQPRAEPSATAPSFAQATSPTSAAQVSTAPSGAAGAARVSGQAPVTAATAERTSATDSPELFAALPAPTVPTAPARQAEPPSRQPVAQPASANPSMTDMVAFDPLADMTQRSVARPDSSVSMELTLTRRNLINRYCDRSQADRSESTKLAVCDDDTNELAQRMPDAATAGTPIPGRVESPTLNNP